MSRHWILRRLRSASSTTLDVRRTLLSTVGDRAFPVAAARLAVERSSRTSLLPISLSSSVVLNRIFAHFLIPLSVSFICTVPTHWLAILDTIIVITFNIQHVWIIYRVGFLFPAVSFIGAAFVKCNAVLSVCLTVVAASLLGLSTSCWAVNHLDLAPPFARELPLCLFLLIYCLFYAI